MARDTTSALPYLPVARPAIDEGDVEAVADVLRSGWLTTGPRVRAFEAAFAAYVGAPHAIALNSCTAGLHLALLAARIGPGDEVVTSPLTFCATVNVILHVGATPVFADVDPVTHTLDPSAAGAAVTRRTRALLPIHLAGRPADVLALRDIAARNDLVTIEDAAHCVEGRSSAGKVGTSADFTCFSFYATKNISTGEGGMVTTGSDEAAAFMRAASLHGLSRDGWARYAKGGTAFYDVVTPGYKYNMMDIQAALGLRQLTRLEEMQASRARVWAAYDAGLEATGLRLPASCPPGVVHARHLYQVLVDPSRCGSTRDRLAAALAEEGIGTSVHFRPVHLFSYYTERFGYAPGAFPVAERVAAQTLSLPLSGAMTVEDAERVVDAIRRCLGRRLPS